ncbi:MAG: c-type cytochrome [Chloroflexi bacterium]|nr:c-type cytochrome [Chloroflexota bacterium]
MKLKLLLAFGFAFTVLVVLAFAVQAQPEPPPPYAGMKNPFPWDDTAVQNAGKTVYQRSCLGCHGANGGSLAVSDFSKGDFAKDIETRPDYYFWRVSEGNLSKGMPPFKSLSDEQRWQALTYIRSLGQGTVSQTMPPTAPIPGQQGSVTMGLTVSEQNQPDYRLALAATVQDGQGKPVDGASVRFFLKADFFATGLAEIGDAFTDNKGIATFEYVPKQSGTQEIVARYEGTETAATVTVAEANVSLYSPHAGIKLPSAGPAVFLGPKSALQLGEKGAAPTAAFRLPGGAVSWLWLFAGVLLLVWTTYFRVVYQLFRVSTVREVRDPDIKFLPMLGLGMVVTIGILLVFMVLTGPHSHFHLHP